MNQSWPADAIRLTSAISGFSAIFLGMVGCDKPTVAKPQAPRPYSLPEELRTSKPDEEIVAGFPERDRKVYLDLLANPTIAKHAALLGVAYEYQKKGDHPEAARVLRRLVEVFPDFAAGWTELAGELAYFAPAESEEVLKRARTLNPSVEISRPNIVATNGGAEIEQLLKEGKTREASELVDKLASGKSESDWEFHRMAARAKLRDQNSAAAIPYAERALALNPRDSETKVVLGTALARTGQAAKGEKLLTEMAGRFSMETDFQIQLAEARLRAGLLEAAETPARQAVKLAPNAAQTHGILGMVLMGLQRTSEAVDELRVATQLEPQSKEGWISLSSALTQGGQYKEALESCERGLAIAPDNALLQANRGLIFLHQKEWDKATLGLQKTVKLDPSDALSWNNLGFVLLKQKRAKDAVAALEQAVKLSPTSSAAWTNLAVATRLTGDTARSKLATQKARALPADAPQIFRYGD